ncbi:TIGR00297 family protein [Methanobrevibacter filiformis]|uniref:Cytidylyltransferase family protein n=1 Tax=Methanobrevibacter filiformis TaxID=55758 RepID=A0A166CPW4_9EURY|nr:TIGR00297 family protein [Methanobrevibacter filiformis]KZX14743.1 hypothetical protein MBFIL_08060 [Methanobrevibacter filiformis]
MNVDILIGGLSYVIVLIALSVVIYRRKSLDALGCITMVVMGIIIIFSANINWLIILFLFLFISLIATRYKKPYKLERGLYEGQRTAKNVISNGLIACIMSAIGGLSLFLFGDSGLLFTCGFIGAVSTATSDTLASEIGVLRQPRLITTLKKVEPGTDGGISPLGTLIGIIGSGFIGLSAFVLGLIPNLALALIISIISGTIGCFMDSILGAVLEQKKILNNEHVNLLGTFTGSIIGILFSFIF